MADQDTEAHISYSEMTPEQRVQAIHTVRHEVYQKLLDKEGAAGYFPKGSEWWYPGIMEMGFEDRELKEKNANRLKIHIEVEQDSILDAVRALESIQLGYDHLGSNYKVNVINKSSDQFPNPQLVVYMDDDSAESTAKAVLLTSLINDFLTNLHATPRDATTRFSKRTGTYTSITQGDGASKANGKLGFHLRGASRTGEDALEYLKEFKEDLVFKQTFQYAELFEEIEEESEEVLQIIRAIKAFAEGDMTQILKTCKPRFNGNSYPQFTLQIPQNDPIQTPLLEKALNATTNKLGQLYKMFNFQKGNFNYWEDFSKRNAKPFGFDKTNPDTQRTVSLPTLNQVIIWPFELRGVQDYLLSISTFFKLEEDPISRQKEILQEYLFILLSFSDEYQELQETTQLTTTEI